MDRTTKLVQLINRRLQRDGTRLHHRRDGEWIIVKGKRPVLRGIDLLDLALCAGVVRLERVEL